MSKSETVENVRNRIRQHHDLRMGLVKKKVMLLLLGGLSLGLSGSPSTSWKIIGAMQKEWKELNKQGAERAINSLYASRLVAIKENADGTCSLILSEKGRRRALTFNLNRIKIKTPAQWDGLWRLISFDVPVGKKEVRDSLREHLLRLGFFEVQQSLCIHPFDCVDEITYITELYDARKYVRFMLVAKADNEVQLKKFFGIK